MLRNPWIGWLKPSLWPEVDPPGHLFLARAFNVVGEAMFEDDWTGSEVEDAGKPIPEHLPSPGEVFLADDKRHAGLFRHYGPIVAKACNVPAEEVDRPMWVAVHGYHRQERERVMQAIYRRKTVAEKCAELARSGDLRFVARKRLRGGDLLAIEPSEWQVDFPWMPFALLGFDEANGLCSPAPTHWLFVTLDSLNYVLGISAPPPEAASEGPAKPEGGVPPAVVDTDGPTPGRPRGTYQYDSDEQIIQDVISDLDGGLFKGVGRLTKAIKARLDTIEPKHLSDAAKVKRLRSRILACRSDLAA